MLSSIGLNMIPWSLDDMVISQILLTYTMELLFCTIVRAYFNILRNFLIECVLIMDTCNCFLPKYFVRHAAIDFTITGSRLYQPSQQMIAVWTKGSSRLPSSKQIGNTATTSSTTTCKSTPVQSIETSIFRIYQIVTYPVNSSSF